VGFPYININTSSPIQTSTAVFAANQVIGSGINVLSGAPPQGFIQAINITCKSTVNAQVDVMFFTSSMPNTTFTDHSSIAISSLDAFSLGPVVNVTNWAYCGTAASVGNANGLAYEYWSGQTQQLYFALVARAALIVNSTADFQVAVTIVS
jgi:hypothetical protein